MRHRGEFCFPELAAPHPRLICENAPFGHPSWTPWNYCKNRRTGSAEPPSGAALPDGLHGPGAGREVRTHPGGDSDTISRVPGDRGAHAMAAVVMHRSSCVFSSALN
jgi:hypothetical protein